MLKHICLYTKASEYQAHTTWGGGVRSTPRATKN